MNELVVSASDFRVHLKELANDVAAGRERVLMERHGYPMVALVSQQDLNFLRRYKSASPSDGSASTDGSQPLPPDTSPKATPDLAEAQFAPTPPDDQDLVLQARRHPDTMETAEIQRLYEATKNAAHIDAVWWWRLKAYTVLSLRGQCPAQVPM